MRILLARDWTRENRVAALALALGVVACVAAVADAVRLEPPPVVDAPAGVPRVPTLPPRPVTLPAAEILAAVERDPFATGPMYEPFRATAGAPAPSPDSATPPAVRLAGVVLLPGGGAAALSVDGRPTQLVRVDGQIDGWRLERVSARAATVTGPGGTLHLRLADPAPPAALAAGGTP